MSLKPTTVRTTLQILSAFALLTLLFYLRVLVGESTLFGRFDNSVQFYAWSQFSSRWIHSGIIPLWDPMQFSGHTFVGEAQTGIFYPFNLLCIVIFGSKEGISLVALEASLMFGSFFAAVSMFYCCRKLGLEQLPAAVAATIFAFTGFLGTRMVGQVALFNASIWLPIVFLFFLKSCEEQRISRSLFWSAASGTMLAMSLLAGHIQPLLYIFLFLALYSTYRFATSGSITGPNALRFLCQLGMVALMVVLIGGIQLFPSMEYDQLAVRWMGGNAPVWPGEKVPYSVVKEFQLSPSDLLGFLSPHLSHSQEGSAYFGMIPLVFFCVGMFFLSVRKSLFFYLVCLLSVLYAFGTQTFVYDFFFYNVPFFDKIRAPIRALYLFHFSGAVVCGFALQGLLSEQSEEKRGRIVRALGFLLIAGFMVFLVVLLGGHRAQSFPQVFQGSGIGALPMFALFLVGSCLLIWMFLSSRISRFAFLTLSGALVLLDIAFSSASLFPPNHATLSPGKLYTSNAALEFLRRDTSLYRVDVRENAMPPNSGDVFDIQCLMGHGGSMDANYFRFRSECWSPDDPLYRLLNVKYVVTKEDMPGHKKVVDGDIKLYQLNSLPRLWHADTTLLIPNSLDAYQRMKGADFDLRRQAVVHVPLPTPLNSPPKHIHYSITQYTPHRIVIACASDAPALLVLSEQCYPGWRCTINGKPADILRTDGIFRGVIAPAGLSEIVFRYDPGTVRLGYWTMAAGMVLLMGLGTSLRRR